MTESLAEKPCTPCRGGVPPLPRDEALRFQAQAPDWELRDDARRIERTFRFRNFPGSACLRCSKSASLPRAKVITPISVSAGVTRPFL
jgi:4a-hydroxytetrahydrobiopterin dehydratase